MPRELVLPLRPDEGVSPLARDLQRIARRKTSLSAPARVCASMNA